MTIDQAIKNALILLLIFVGPLLFIPLFGNIYQAPKTILLAAVAIALLLTLVVDIFFKKTVTLRVNKLTTPLTLIITTLTINLLVTQEARAESFFSKCIVILTLSLIAWFITQFDHKAWLIRATTNTATLLGAVLSIFSILQITYLHNLATLPIYMQTQTFTPTGSLLHTTIILAVAMGIAVTGVIASAAGRIKNTLLAGITLVGIVANLTLILPSGKFALHILPYSASWSLLLDSAKSFITFLFGQGLSNFTPLYTLAKPLFLNQTYFWNINPEVASSELFTLMITGGLLLTLALIMYVAATYLGSKKDPTSLPLLVGFGLTTLSLIIFPGSIVLYLYLFLFAALLVPTTSHHTFSASSLQLRLILVILGLALTATAIYFVGKNSLAEHSLYRAQLAVQGNNTKDVYDNTLRAVSLMPGNASYRLAYSQLNLTLASSLSQTKSELSEQDQNEITQLVSIAIREGQAATTLRPSLAITWQNLGSIYRNLIGVASGAEDYAVQYYGTAVAKDPGNPSLRIEYGGLFYQLADSPIATQPGVTESLLSRAIEQFQIAANLKGDYANAYYNLSKAQEKAGNQDLAIELLTKTLTLLDPLSQDYTTASQELAALKSNKDAEVKEPAQEELQTQQDLPTEILSSPDEPLELPPPTL
jgi:hypothetical protein